MNIYGWKWNAGISAGWLLVAIFEFLFLGNGKGAMAYLFCACGYLGWALEERKNLN